MKITAPAKINLFLDITGTLDNGYHVLDMIMASTSLADTLEIEKLDDSALADEIVCDIPLPENNTLTKMLAVLREENLLSGFYQIKLTKRIPEQAGLGGASADAAALLHGLNKIENLQLGMEQMEKLGAKTGADVPFCLHDGFARVQGFGEIVTPFLEPDASALSVLLLKPDAGVSTPQAFALYDAMQTGKPSGHAENIDNVQKAVQKENLNLLYENVFNVLEPAAFSLVPELMQAVQDLYDSGVKKVVMSGSGACLIGLAEENILDCAAKRLEKSYPFVEKVRIGCSRQSIQS
jgi:4-diphosphocytidyl-2-C-methyl-D-erythritol kinase